MDEISLQIPKVSFSRDVTYCHAYIRDRWPKVLYLFRDITGHDLVITCTFRSPEEQYRLWRKGRLDAGQIVTNCDGVNTKSQHNHFPSRAVDVAVAIDNGQSKETITWQEEQYTPLRDVCHKLNLEWGGNWTSFKDLPHIQVPKGVV